MEVARLQAYFRELARRRLPALAMPPFILFGSLLDRGAETLFAIPEATLGDNPAPALTALVNLCRRQGRPCRIDYLDEAAPTLAATLLQMGFVEERRTRLAVCTPATYWPATAVPGLTVAPLLATATLGELREYLNTHEQAFTPGAALVDDTAAEGFRRELIAGAQAFIARLDGLAVGVGLLAIPIDGLAGVFGVATLGPFRRRGVAAVLTARAVQTAFGLGVAAVLIDTDDDEAERVYERIGFRSVAYRLIFSRSV